MVEYDDCFEFNVDLDDNFLIGNKHLYVVDYKNITRYTLDADGFLASLAYNISQEDGWLIKKSDFRAFLLTMLAAIYGLYSIRNECRCRKICDCN